MSNPKFEIECVMWNNAREKENKWEIVDDASGSYSMVPDLANIKVESNTICLDEKRGEAYRVVEGQKQTLDYKKTEKIRDNREKTGKTIKKATEREENVI